MDGKRLIKSISLKNFLSYGSEGITIELEPLNVLIGANGSGKSNLIEALRWFRATPRNLAQPINEGGGVDEWIWKGKQYSKIDGIRIRAIVHDGDPFAEENDYVDHELVLYALGNRVSRVVEDINAISFYDGHSRTSPLYGRQQGKPALWREVSMIDDDGMTHWTREPVELKELIDDQSVLAQRKDRETYPTLTYLAEQYEGIKLYTDTSLGRFTPARKPQDAYLDQTFLFEDGSNLALVLNDLQNKPETMRLIIDKLGQFYDRVENIITRIIGGFVQVYIQEKGLDRTVSATRLSDGTLRYLCLLVILCHPDPPPLICIEEPELGMHPDIIPTIAELLIEASKRTQLIVTTHSEMLVSALGDVPESVVICEREETGSTLRRLDRESMKVWLEKYTLGDLWMSGELGGTRW